MVVPIVIRDGDPLKPMVISAEPWASFVSIISPIKIALARRGFLKMGHTESISFPSKSKGWQKRRGTLMGWSNIVYVTVNNALGP